MSNLSHLTFISAQINPVVGDIAGNMKRIADVMSTHAHADVIIFPELVTSGYPPEDLVLRPSFMASLTQEVTDLCATFSNFQGLALISSPWIYEQKLVNAVLVISQGQIKAVYPKHHLPNYGVFDEQRIFNAGDMPLPYDYKGVKLGILTCEDLWFDDVTAHLKQNGADILISPNGSPYDTDKQGKRLEIAYQRCTTHDIPLIYVNQMGGQDELVFDGGSFAMNAAGQIIDQSPFFAEDIHPVSMNSEAIADISAMPSSPLRNDPLTHGYNDDDYAHIYQALCLGVRDYITKNGFKGILLGLSGGIDSALSAVIAADAIGAENLHCVMMPSPYTAQISLDDAAELADNLGCPYEIKPIAAAVDSITNMIGTDAQTGIAAENIQSRLRGMTLMALSNAKGHMVLSTGNKSEMAVGYATLYGDMCGGFNALKDVYKIDVFALSRFVNQQAGYNRIPDRIITRPPSAELRPDQTDQDSLPPYDILDAILKGLIEEQLGLDEMVARGYDADTIQHIWRLLDRAEYKRRQAPPGVKITRRAFGRERRYPMTNGYREEKQHD